MTSQTADAHHRPPDRCARTGWSTYAAALRALGNSRGRFAGLGFVFTPLDPFCGIDLDNALAGPGGKLLPWARAIVERLATYAELSPSGRGVKLFLRGCLPRGQETDGWNNRVRHFRRGPCGWPALAEHRRCRLQTAPRRLHLIGFSGAPGRTIP